MSCISIGTESEDLITVIILHREISPQSQMSALSGDSSDLLKGMFLSLLTLLFLCLVHLQRLFYFPICPLSSQGPSSFYLWTSCDLPYSRSTAGGLSITPKPQKSGQASTRLIQHCRFVYIACLLCYRSGSLHH